LPMKTKKPARTVSGMTVFTDIRGLLSAAPRPGPEPEARARAEPDTAAERARLEERLKGLEELVRSQRTALDRLEAENKELGARLREHQSAAVNVPPREAGSGRLSTEIADLEAQRVELSAALSQIEDLLRLQIRELARRIARVYEEAGDIGANRDFRRLTDQLEAAENFGEFVRALLRG
jgi:chromosome segregation ATPase